MSNPGRPGVPGPFSFCAEAVNIRIKSAADSLGGDIVIFEFSNNRLGRGLEFGVFNN